MSKVSLHVVVPGPLDTRTGGYVYDRRLIDALRVRGHSVIVHELYGTWPWADAPTLERATSLFESLPEGSLTLVDGLAFSAMPDVIARAAHRLSLAALVHHPLALEGGSTLADTRRLREAETKALSHAVLVFTTSATTTDTLLNDYGVPAAKVVTVPPGTDAAPLAQGSGSGSLNLLCVATLTPRKGHTVLLDALAEITDFDWQLVCTGSTTRDPATTRSLQVRIERYRLAERVTLTGELSDAALDEYWHNADLFVLASRFEGYGMVFDEALARALPIIASGAGAVASTIPNDAGLTLPPDDPVALRQALTRWFTEPAFRTQLRAGAQQARGRRRDWAAVANDYATAFDTLTTP